MIRLIALIAIVVALISGTYGAQKILNKSTPVISNIPSASTSPSSSVQADTNARLLALAGGKYEDGNLPLGDNKYTTDTPKKGYIYLCNARTDGQGGAGNDGPWIHGTTWNIKEKISVSGNKTWPNAQFTNTISGTSRTLSGNDLPTTHVTGIYPIMSTDAAYKYDRNPNSISAQQFSLNVPAIPTYSETPNCMGGEVGVMLTGVAIFNGFDAGLRDAAAHEVQDSCQGHPQVSGEYHYHSLSSCINDVSVSTVIGFALDGFPITGPQVTKDKYLTTDNLDECHGLTSEINLDGKKVSMYHYVMTEDFPYSVSCFRGKVTSKQLIPMGGTQTGSQNRGSGQPPQEAISSCSGKSQNATCQFTTPNGTITGTCQTPPGTTTLACVPNQRP